MSQPPDTIIPDEPCRERRASPADHTPDERSRREFLRRGAAVGAGLLTFVVAGRECRLSAAQARANGVPYRTFSESQVRTLEALGEILLPGSPARGLAHFIDQQLSGPPADSMLMIKYLGVRAPYTDFYTAGLAGAEGAAVKQFSRAVSSLAPPEAHALVAGLASGTLAGWNGPPAPLFYFVLRNDAVDVTYGTVAGFERLGVPYMPHVAPPPPDWSV